MVRLICANDVLSPDDFDRYLKVLEVDFPKLYVAYIENIRIVNALNTFLDVILEAKKSEGK